MAGFISNVWWGQSKMRTLVKDLKEILESDESNSVGHQIFLTKPEARKFLKLLGVKV